MEKPLIFVTNDDGVGANGLKAAIEVARKFGRVVAVAPERPQSGKAHSITMYSPLYLRKVREEEDVIVYACDGTPVDCVKMAFDYLLQNDMPVLSISGINHGSNSSIAVIYSGTMGAAIEAGFYNIPSIGFSLEDEDAEADFDAAIFYGSKIVKYIIESEMKMPLCLNVNIPKGTIQQVEGIRICRQNRGYFRERFEQRNDPRGRDYFWLTGELVNKEPEATDTDLYALSEGFVSVVPIQVDLTNFKQMDDMRRIIR